MQTLQLSSLHSNPCFLIQTNHLAAKNIHPSAMTKQTFFFFRQPVNGHNVLFDMIQDPALRILACSPGWLYWSPLKSESTK